MTRQVSPAGRAVTRGFETFVPFTYDDAFYPPRPAAANVPVKGTLTIGYGQTGPEAWFGRRCTEPQAEVWFENSLGRAAAAVDRECEGVELTQGQFDALADFIFSAGLGNFEHSTLLKDLLARDFADVPHEIARFNHVDGRVIPGLDRRRAAEIALWNGVGGAAPASTRRKADPVV